jgi:hypothetical protein
VSICGERDKEASAGSAMLKLRHSRTQEECVCRQTPNNDGLMIEVTHSAATHMFVWGLNTARVIPEAFGAGSITC